MLSNGLTYFKEIETEDFVEEKNIFHHYSSRLIESAYVIHKDITAFPRSVEPAYVIHRNQVSLSYRVYRIGRAGPCYSQKSGTRSRPAGRVKAANQAGKDAKSIQKAQPRKDAQSSDRRYLLKG